MKSQWTKEDIKRLYKYSKQITQGEAAKKLNRTRNAVGKKSRSLGITWLNRWTRQEELKLYQYSEITGKSEAARLLGRPVSSVFSKCRSLGIRWGQGFWNLAKIADKVGCSRNTVKRLVDILYPDKKIFYVCGKRRFYIIGHQDAEKIIRILNGTRKHRKNYVKAGKARWAEK